MTDKEKLEALESALIASANFSQKATDRIAQHDAAIKSLSKLAALTAGVAGLGTGGVIGILTAPYIVQFIKTLF